MDSTEREDPEVDGLYTGFPGDLGGGGSTVGPNEEEARGGGDIAEFLAAGSVEASLVAEGGCEDAREELVKGPSAMLAWLRLKRGEGVRQLPKTASWNALTVGEGLSSSSDMFNEGRSRDCTDNDMLGLGRASSTSPEGVL